MRKICIDAGHYGKYNKSKVFPSYYESDMTWKLHLLLKKELEEYGFEVITTRDKKDVDLALDKRGAKSKGCDLFVSLHSNACDTESVDRAVIIPYQDVNWTDIDDESREIAEKLGACVQNVMGLSSYQIYTRKAGNDRDRNGKLDDEYYGVLYGARKVGTVGIIVEHGFHTNTKCAKWLSDDSNLEKLAKAEAKTIAEYFKVNKVTEKAETPIKTPKKTIDELATEVIQGKWGTGEARKKALTDAGYNFTEVQKEVNRRYAKKPITEIAREVIRGEWGVGQDRKNRLTKAGYDYAEVQGIVNKLLK